MSARRLKRLRHLFCLRFPTFIHQLYAQRQRRGKRAKDAHDVRQRFITPRQRRPDNQILLMGQLLQLAEKEGEQEFIGRYAEGRRFAFQRCDSRSGQVNTFLPPSACVWLLLFAPFGGLVRRGKNASPILFGGGIRVLFLPLLQGDIVAEAATERRQCWRSTGH